MKEARHRSNFYMLVLGLAKTALRSAEAVKRERSREAEHPGSKPLVGRCESIGREAEV